MNQSNVIHLDPATWYCARQCQESIKHLTSLRDPMYDVEIRCEKELLKQFKREILTA